MKLKKVLIMAGGTGGHVFPGLAVAKKMQAANIEVHWLGTPNGMESKLVFNANIFFHTITISGVRGKNFLQQLLAPFKLFFAILQAMRIIHKLKPDCVLGMGGFVSGPGGIASWLLRYPLVIHEQNAKAGMTNRWLAKVAKKVLEAFPNTFSASDKVVTVGNPVRKEIMELGDPAIRFQGRQGPLRLLVLGGSLGAQAINDLMPEVLEGCDFEVVHQTGEKHFAVTKVLYDNKKITAAKVMPFIHNMAEAYGHADLVLCRAGALTISELCAAGVGAILVPFPFAVDDHQTTNGNFMAEKQAAILIQQKVLTKEKLKALLEDFNQHREKCLIMAEKAYALRTGDACAKVLTICEEVL